MKVGEWSRDFSVSAAVAGLVALVATYSGPVLIVVQAARAGNLGAEVLSTWIWALSMGAAVLGLWHSIRRRIPVIGAWSTPGVALLITGLAQYRFSDVIGCYLVVTVLIAWVGLSGVFTRLMRVLPTHLLSAMIAGVMFQFCARIFQSLQQSPALVLPVIGTYLLARRFMPRYAVALGLLTGLAMSVAGMGAETASLTLTLVKPVLSAPTFNVEAIVGLGLPLFLLALTQYATGVTVLRQAGYEVSDRSLVGSSGLISIPLSLFGSAGINPAAIVAAICAGPECHPDPRRRYIAGLVCGVGYLVAGAFGASMVALFAMLPAGMIATLAGLALLGTLVSNLSGCLSEPAHRESACITFAVTVSGMSFFGLGSALWGLVAGWLFLAITTPGRAGGLAGLLRRGAGLSK